LSCQVFKNGAKEKKEKKLIAYWRSFTDWDTRGPELKTNLRLPDAIWSGPVMEVRKPVDNLFKRHSLVASILAIAALFGALSAIRDYFSVLFTVPSVGLSYPDSESKEVDFIAGQPIAVQLKMLSEV